MKKNCTLALLLVLAMAWTIVRIFVRGVTKSQKPAGPDERGEANA